MLWPARVAYAYSGFVFLGLLDLTFRFFWAARLTFTCNTGVFWGMSFPEWLMLPVLILFLGYLLVLFVRYSNTLAKLSLAAMLSGGSVNLVDRLGHGCVLDYWAWPGVLATIFPNFNLGDMLLLLGLLGLGWTFLKRS